MGRIYYCPLPDLATGTDSDQDIFRLNAGASDKCILHGFEIYSSATAATALNLRLLRRTTDGTGGTGQTEVPADANSQAATAALTTLVTAPGTAGDIFAEYTWEQLGPLVYLPTPEMQIALDVSTRIALNLQTDPSSVTMTGWVCWEEI